MLLKKISFVLRMFRYLYRGKNRDLKKYFLQWINQPSELFTHTHADSVGTSLFCDCIFYAFTQFHSLSHTLCDGIFLLVQQASLVLCAIKPTLQAAQKSWTDILLWQYTVWLCLTFKLNWNLLEIQLMKILWSKSIWFLSKCMVRVQQ